MNDHVNSANHLINPSFQCDACKRKKRCSLRACTNVKRVVVGSSESKQSKLRMKDESDEESTDETKIAEPKSTPKIRLRVSGSKSSSTKKRKASPRREENDEELDDGNSQGSSSRKRARRTRSPAPSDQSDGEMDDYDEMFDIENLEAEYKKLHDASFIDARNNLSLHGTWRLPKALEYKESSFKEVAKITLINISR